MLVRRVPKTKAWTLFRAVARACAKCKSNDEYRLIEPDTSQMITTGAGLVPGRAWIRGMPPRPARRAARKVARMSMRRPRGSIRRRRVENRRQERTHRRHRRLGAGDLLLAHLLEVLLAQDLAGGPGEHGVGLHPRRLRRGRLPAGERGGQRLREPAAELAARQRLGPALGQRQSAEPLEQSRTAPEDVESLIEDLAVRDPVHEPRVQGPVEVLPVLDADRPHGLRGRHDVSRPDPHSAGSQHPGEAHEVREQQTAAPPARGPGGAHPPLRPARPRPAARHRSPRGFAPPRCRGSSRCRPGT